jgi:hypothetical protein
MFPEAPNGAIKRLTPGFKGPGRQPEKARIHTGGVASLQQQPVAISEMA